MALKPITRQEQIIAGKDLKPITRMEKFLKQYGGGGSGGGAQSDWNQTDSSAADFIKNKTHGYESAVFAPEQTFTPSAEGAPLEYILSPEINSEVTVVFDGESYVYTAEDFFGTGVGVGNIDILMGTAEESGGPCLVAFMPEQNMCMVMTIDQTTSHTIKVTGKNLYKIPNIYYDQCAYFYVDGDGGADAIIHNHFALQSPVTLEELRDAVNNSKIVLYENSSSDLAKQYGTYYPFYVECYTGQNWGTVYVYKKDGSVGQYHTAEYTP